MKNKNRSRRKNSFNKMFSHQEKLNQQHRRHIKKSGANEYFLTQSSSNIARNKLVLPAADTQRSEIQLVDAKCYNSEENTFFPFISEKSLPQNRKNESYEEANRKEAVESSCLENGSNDVKLKADYLNRKRVDFVYPASQENHSHYRLFFFSKPSQYGCRSTDREISTFSEINDNSVEKGTRCLLSIEDIHEETKKIAALSRIDSAAPIPRSDEDNRNDDPAREVSPIKIVIEPFSKNFLRQDQPYSFMGSLQLSYGATSVKDVVRDESGNRPRSNSTDVELKLPQRGLCEERAVLATHCWRSDLPHSSRGWLLTKLSQSRTPGMQNLVRIVLFLLLRLSFMFFGAEASFYLIASLLLANNQGNTCFLNATLQCLAYLPTFCQCITSLSISSSSKIESDGQKIILMMRSLMRRIHSLDPEGGNISSTISPRGLVSVLPRLGGSKRRFQLGRQEDAHEFLVYLLDAMKDGELIEAGKFLEDFYVHFFVISSEFTECICF